MFLRRPPSPVNDLGVLRSFRPLFPLLLILIRSITRSAARHVRLGATDLLQQQACRRLLVVDMSQLSW